MKSVESASHPDTRSVCIIRTAVDVKHHCRSLGNSRI